MKGWPTEAPICTCAGAFTIPSSVHQREQDSHDCVGEAMHRQLLELALAAVQGLQPLLIESAQAGHGAGDVLPSLQAVMLNVAGMCTPAAPGGAQEPLTPSSGCVRSSHTYSIPCDACTC